MGHGRHGGWGAGWGESAASSGSSGSSGPPWGPSGRSSGPPPWLAGLFGQLAANAAPAGRGPRVRRGDVRAAILDVLRSEPMNGYQVITQIAERTDGAWKPSPGSVYPTISQLEDEGLVEGVDDDGGRRRLRPTPAGWTWIETHADELAAVWKPFEQPDRGESGPDYASLKPEIGQVMNAAWQIITTGTERQKRDAIEVLVDTRRRLYGLLAEGDAQ